MRYFLTLSYRGTAYNGWQRQPDAPSVQAVVEEALRTLRPDIKEITGAGRTDTGVHARRAVAHFDTLAPIADTAKFCYHLSALLPDDIAALDVRRVHDDAHARFDAIRREYQYHILSVKDPFRREIAWQYYRPLDVEAMNEAADKLLSFNDFTTFSKLHSGNRTTICEVSAAYWERHGEELIFTIAADRFLRNMVRAIVGMLVDVGRGKLSVQGFDEAMRSLDRTRCSGSAPARGLFLTDVAYPEGIFVA